MQCDSDGYVLSCCVNRGTSHFDMTAITRIAFSSSLSKGVASV